MSSNPPETQKRTYIRRKKYLNDAMSKIKEVLEFVRNARHEKTNDTELLKIANCHALAIEAACWSPHSRLSSAEYQNLMMAKTQDLCQVLTKGIRIVYDNPVTPKPCINTGTTFQEMRKTLIKESHSSPVIHSESRSSSDCGSFPSASFINDPILLLDGSSENVECSMAPFDPLGDISSLPFEEPYANPELI